MSFERIVQTLPLAVAMQFSPTANAVAMPEKGETTDPGNPKIQVKETTSTPDLITSTIEKAFSLSGENFSQTIRYATNNWSEKMANRFDELATLEAVGTITNEQASELEALQQARRRHESPPSGEEILFRHKREKLDLQLLTLLQKNVRIHPLSPYNT